MFAGFDYSRCWAIPSSSVSYVMLSDVAILAVGRRSTGEKGACRHGVPSAPVSTARMRAGHSMTLA